MAGLSAAWTLERAGFRDYVVLELEPEPGGTARSGTGPVSPYPWGAHYVTAPAPGNRPMRALLEEVGAITGDDAAGRPVYAEDVLCREPAERVYFRGEWYQGLYPRVGASRAEIDELTRFERDMRRWAGYRDRAGRHGFTSPRASGSDADELRALDRMSMADLLDEGGYGSERLRWYVEYACRDDYGTTLAQTSAWAGVFYFAARREHEDDDSAPFLTWPEGNGRLVRHLAELAGPRLRTGALVTDVRPGADRVEVSYEDASGEPRELTAPFAVFALPRFLAKWLLAPYRERPPAHLAPVTYGTWMVANLTLRDRPYGYGFPLAWDNVLYASPSLGYVVATHQSGHDYGPTVLTYYLPLTDDDPDAARTRAMATTWHSWVEGIVADLGPAHPGLAELLTRVDVYLWGHAMVRPLPGLLWSPSLGRCAEPFGRLHFAHTDLSGMALAEEAQYWGVRAAEAVLAGLGHRFSSWQAT